MLGRKVHFNGQPLPVGAYNYRLIADLPFDEIEIFTGTLNIASLMIKGTEELVLQSPG